MAQLGTERHYYRRKKNPSTPEPEKLRMKQDGMVLQQIKGWAT